jgi:hypothetical protein
VSAFVVFGFAVQLLLLAFFAAHLWRPTRAATFGHLVYAMGLLALGLAIAFVIERQPWHLVLAFVLYLAWSAVGATVDVIWPVEWRSPPRWSILVPYGALLIAALVALWIPLWWVDRRLWVGFGLLYAAHTILNVAAHHGTPTPQGGTRPGRA